MRRRAYLTSWEYVVLSSLANFKGPSWYSLPKNLTTLSAMAKRRLVYLSSSGGGTKEKWGITPEGLAVTKLYQGYPRA